MKSFNTPKTPKTPRTPRTPKIPGIVFALLLALTGKATVAFGSDNETRFVVESAWFVGNNEWLAYANIDLTGDIEGGSLEFPEVIPADIAWAGATVTDGNIIGTIIALPSYDPDATQTFLTQQGDIFQDELRTNAVIIAAFPDSFQMNLLGSTLYLFSPELSDSDIGWDIGALGLEAHWELLRLQTHFGFIQYYPERLLLPVLPEEQEDESAFVKRVRKRSAKNYTDGQYTGTIESLLIGLLVMDDEFKVIWDKRHITGTEQPDETEQPPPFLFGGFIDPNAPIGMSFRVPQTMIEKTFKDPNFGIRLGTRVIPPEERGDNQHRHNFIFSIGVGSDLEEEDGFHLIRDGNLHVLYPKQSEDRPAEEGILSNAEWDEINHELAYSVLPFLAGVRESFLLLDSTLPTDFAVSTDGSAWYLAFTYATAETQIDWELIEHLRQTIIDHMRKGIPPDNPQYELFGMLFQVDIQEFTPGKIAGLTCYQVDVSLLGTEFALVYYVHEPGIIYAAILPLGNPDEAEKVIDAQHGMMLWQLERKIENSRRGVAENLEPPKTVLRGNADGFRLHVDYEPTPCGRGHRVTAHVARDSFGNVIALGQQFGLDPLQMLPFLQTP